VVCCDCNAPRCSTGICICTSQLKKCPRDKGWSRWDPLSGHWVPAGENPFALVA
jgi:hypothetical protein